MLTRIEILIIGIFLISIVAFTAFSIWWWVFRKPLPPPTKTCVATQPNTACTSNGIVAAIEKLYDDSMPSPITSLKLNSFNASASFAPWCMPSFYAIRFVDEEGNYGDLSEWYGPVVASSSVVPGGCSANVPLLSVIDKSDPNLSKYYTNVHRQDNVLDENSEGTIMGMLYSDIYSFIDDPATNPNSDFSIYPCKAHGCSRE